jgi:hypothetical protein
MRFAFGCGASWRQDPGPCPVDDTPHTACTPESVAKGALVTRTRAPRSMAATLEAMRVRGTAGTLEPGVAPVPDVATATAPVISTKTYRRAVHGRGVRGARARD